VTHRVIRSGWVCSTLLAGAMASVPPSAQAQEGAAPAASDATLKVEATSAQSPSASVEATSAPAEATSTADSAPEAAPAEAMPWSEPELPAFLDTVDRRLKDQRPPPTKEQLAALAEMEREVERFRQSGDTYKDTVVAIVRREYLRQRRMRNEGYARQISEEERLQDEATEKSIALFERFIQQYPNDPTYTPDAMFRLGELYFERSAIQFQNAVTEAMAARDRGEEVPEPDKDFTPTINLYRDLITRFPDYPRIDGVYYLIGYCLNEMGEPDKARIAWLNLVCANQYDFRDAIKPNEELAEKAEREASRRRRPRTPRCPTPTEAARPRCSPRALRVKPGCVSANTTSITT
jgi:TolA-binding protein